MADIHFEIPFSANGVERTPEMLYFFVQALVHVGLEHLKTTHLQERSQRTHHHGKALVLTLCPRPGCNSA